MWASTNTDGRGSIGQIRIFEFIQKIYPRYTVIWEQPIPSLQLRFDIFIKEIGIAVEVDGSQHERHNPFFHKTDFEPKKGYMNDKAKDEFCELNGIKMIRLNYKEALNITIDDLIDKIDKEKYPEGEYVFSCLN